MVAMKRQFIFLFLIIISLNVSAQINYAEFAGEKSSIILIKQYRFSNIYTYQGRKTDDSTIVKSYGVEIAEEGIARKYDQILRNNTTDSISHRIVLRARLLLEIDNEQHTFIKYRLESPTISDKSFKVVDLINRSGIWEENQRSSAELETIKAVFSQCKPETFFAFSRREDDPKHPVINRLKPLVRNEAGVLNIGQLESVIKQYRNELASYLE
jgi:hypothetical protein